LGHDPGFEPSDKPLKEVLGTRIADSMLEPSDKPLNEVLGTRIADSMLILKGKGKQIHSDRVQRDLDRQNEEYHGVHNPILWILDVLGY
jgi:hypothetical protein